MCWYTHIFYWIIKIWSPLTLWDGRSRQVAMVFMFGPSRCNAEPYKEMSACSHLATGNWPYDVNDPSFSLRPFKQNPSELHREVYETRPALTLSAPEGKNQKMSQNPANNNRKMLSQAIPASRAVTESSTTPPMPHLPPVCEGVHLKIAQWSWTLSHDK